MHFFGLPCQVVEGRSAQLWSFPLGFRAECVAERIRLYRSLRLVFLQPVLVRAVLDQAHGQLVRLQKYLVRIVGFLRDGFAERLQRILGDDSRVAEPLAVGINLRSWKVLRLEHGGSGDFSVRISLRFSFLLYVQFLDLLGVALTGKNQTGNSKCQFGHEQWYGAAAVGFVVADRTAYR